MTDNDRTLDPNDHRWKDRRIAELEAKVERLRENTQTAFHEGYQAGINAKIRGAACLEDEVGAWMSSEARRIAQPLRAATEGINKDAPTDQMARAMRRVSEASDGDEKADSEWLDIIEGECWDLRCLDVATFGGDYEVEWIVIEHHQAAPRQRQIGRGDSPVTALQDAVARTTPAPPTTDAEGEVQKEA